MRSRSFQLAVLVLGLALSAAAQQQWVPLGPDGGDVRSFGRDPHANGRILLGTSSGQIFQSLNDGKTWKRYVQLGNGRDLVLDHIVFHPTRQGTVYIAAWSVEENSGDIFRSVDDGRTWRPLREMRGKSVRAFDLAASNPNVMVAGALDGVYRSADGGDHWSLISPPGHVDIRNIESIAIDPRNPDIIYAGTWHLPWKTTDGGLTWTNIKQGIIDDSDVFSIIIDPVDPRVVYASACSGIYKSETGGSLFRKVQGIPFSARRTRVLKQDPADRNVVYAGTTEGLWKTADGGTTWRRVSSPSLIINDILLDPARQQSLLLATDRSGVLASTDGGEALVASNRGFSHRQVTAILIDQQDSSRIFAGVINDKEFGGVFSSRDGGQSWDQSNTGLGGRDIFSLQQTRSGLLVAGTNRGVFVLDPNAALSAWIAREKVVNVVETTVRATKQAKARTVRKTVFGKLTARINDLHVAPDAWFAATAEGIFATNDEGRSWHGGAVDKQSEFVSVAASADVVVAATRRAVVVSTDRGQSWKSVALPADVSMVANVEVAPTNRIYLAAREGAYRSEDAGLSWQRLTRLPVNQLASIYYDEDGQRLLTTTTTSTQIFQSTDFGMTWKRAETGWMLKRIRTARGRVLATTNFDGIVAHPDSLPATAAASSGSSTGGLNDD
jgi:photosystem II stability/assembly factor-like uncharacterized protein